MKTAAASPEEDSIEPGTRLVCGRYKIITRLGHGGYSTVYLAQSDQGEIALKVLAREFHGNAQAETRLRNEITVARSLADIAGVVHVVDFGGVDEMSNRPYIAMTFAGGPTLAARLIQTTFSVPEACAIVAPLARTVAELHRRDVLHRDLKPSNVIIPSDGSNPVLIDFGLAQSRGRSFAASPRITLADERPGSKYYMAPEQAFGQDSTAATDVYQLAGTLWATLVRKAPQSDLSPHDAVRKKCDGTEPELSIAGLRDDLPQKLVELIDAGLRRNPKERPESAAEFARRLDAIAAEANSAVSRQSRKITELVVAANPMVTPPLVAATQAPPTPPAMAGSLPVSSPDRTQEAAAAWTSTIPTLNETAIPTLSQRRRWLLAIMVATGALAVFFAWKTRDQPQKAAELAAAANSSKTTAKVSPARPRRISHDTKTPPATGSSKDIETAQSSSIAEESPAPEDLDLSKKEETPTRPRSQKKSPRQTKPGPAERPAPRSKPPVDCQSVLDEVSRASQSLRWAKVYALTRQLHRKCWAGNMPEYRRLRAKASMETQHYVECIRVTADTPALKRLSAICKSETNPR